MEYLNKLIKDLEQAEAQKQKDIKRRRLIDEFSTLVYGIRNKLYGGNNT